jgi:hypothetical protein
MRTPPSSTSSSPFGNRTFSAGARPAAGGDFLGLIDAKKMIRIRRDKKSLSMPKTENGKGRVAC